MKNDMRNFYLKLLLFVTVLYFLILTPALFDGATNKEAYIVLVVLFWSLNLLFIIYKYIKCKDNQ